MREAWFSHNGTMPLFLLLIVGIFLFCQFTIPFEQLSYALALRHLGGEAVGCHHGSVVRKRLRVYTLPFIVKVLTFAP